MTNSTSIPPELRPAFPQTNDTWQSGMTLRDWFAGQAIGSIIQRYPYDTWDQCAEAAYGLADALLEKRDGK